MNKDEFLSALRGKLSVLPKEDIEKSVEYYSEIVDDRIEDGISEEEAVNAIGTVDEIASQILLETSLPKLVKERIKPGRALKAWEIVLLVLGFPVWFPLILAAVIIVLAVYIVIWSLVVSLYAIVVSIGACGIVLLLMSGIFLSTGRIPQGLLCIGAGLLFAGITILAFFASNQAAKGILWISKKFLSGIKLCFAGKRDVQ
ncbi:MAG: DUF1700 domain-containing protein [Clostridia bacterium]|nr:DUF1700 domain-containing protein [Clostridia bacterium]